MTKKVRVKAHNRTRPSSGKFTVVSSKKGKVTVRGPGVRTSGSSTRQAKAAAKGLVRYKSNVKFIVENSKKETSSASSVSGKTKEALAKKYKDVDSK